VPYSSAPATFKLTEIVVSQRVLTTEERASLHAMMALYMNGA
jgi:hypothetical protein